VFRFSYRDWDEDLAQKLGEFKELLDLFRYLLLKTDGNVEQALEILRTLQDRGHIDPSVDLEAFARRLEEERIVQSTPRGRALTSTGVRDLRKACLDQVFRGLREGGPAGGHVTPHGGGSDGEALPELREYRFGDDLRSIDFGESLRNAEIRGGNAAVVLQESDLVVRDTEFSTACATALLLDISHSMILYGEDRFTPAKQVALALAELITTRFARDTLDVILFGDEAVPVPLRNLPYASVGPYHTNTKAALSLARRLLGRRRNPNKRIFLVTDGKPTVIDVPGEGVYRNTFGVDPRIVNRTLDEAVQCRRKGIRITTFMVAQDPLLEAFVLRLTELNQGRAYLTSPEGLGGFVLRDFLRGRG
jgi:Ca-activated chloride channel homolog